MLLTQAECCVIFQLLFPVRGADYNITNMLLKKTQNTLYHLIFMKEGLNEYHSYFRITQCSFEYKSIFVMKSYWASSLERAWVGEKFWLEQTKESHSINWAATSVLKSLILWSRRSGWLLISSHNVLLCRHLSVLTVSSELIPAVIPNKLLPWEITLG